VPDDKYLDIQNLDAGYGRSQVLFGVTMSVPWRGGVAVLGRNGAGKTTLMKAIIGELPVLGGSVSLDARDVGRLPTEQRIRMGFGYVPQEHSVFARLSVRDNLAVGAHDLPPAQCDAAEHAGLRFRLEVELDVRSRMEKGNLLGDTKTPDHPLIRGGGVTPDHEDSQMRVAQTSRRFQQVRQPFLLPIVTDEKNDESIFGKPQGRPRGHTHRRTTERIKPLHVKAVIHNLDRPFTSAKVHDCAGCLSRNRDQRNSIVPISAALKEFAQPVVHATMQQDWPRLERVTS